MNCIDCSWFGSENDRTLRKRCPNCGAAVLTAAEQAKRYDYSHRKNLSRWRRSPRGNAWRGWRVWVTR